MDLSAFETFGWREAVMALVVVTAVYMLILSLRLLRFRRQRQRVATAPLAEFAEPGFVSAAAVVADSEPLVEPNATMEPLHTEASFDEQLASYTTDAELRHLRGDLARLRDEVAHLREEWRQLRVEWDGLKGSRNVSPLYHEAMQLAQQGLDANGIADRCGISLGEAELVFALSHKQPWAVKSGKEENGDDAR